MIVHASITAATATTATTNHEIKRDSNVSIPAVSLWGDSKSIDVMAQETIQLIYNINCCSVVFHVFSNGGSFLWEKIRQFLFSNSQKEEHTNPKSELETAIEYRVKSKIIGIVFDSSPAEFSLNPNLISHAMKYCPFRERIQLKAYIFLRKAQMGGRSHDEERNQRASEFWLGMRNCNLKLPQLYLYSTKDILTPLDPLRELIAFRRDLLGREMIHSCEFDSSHCSHYKIYPKEYTSAIEKFLNRCCHSRRSLLARL